MILPFDVVPSASTAGVYFEKYGSFFTSLVRSASWPLSPSVRASVNGTSNTVGSVPAASFAANVGPVHWYSTGLTLIDGFAFSNSATCALNWSIAACVLPGMREATLMVTVFVDEPTAAAVAQTASRPTAATAAAKRLDFIALPFLVRRWTWFAPGSARRWGHGERRLLRGRCSRARARPQPGGEPGRGRSWSGRRSAGRA